MSLDFWTTTGVIATAASALASFIMALLTKRYVNVSTKMVSEMIVTRKETFRP